MHTYIHTGRQSQIEEASNIQRHTYTSIHIQRQMQALWQTIRQADIHTATNHSGRQVGHPYIVAYKHAYRQTYRKAGTQSYGHTGRQAYIYTHNHTYRPYIQT